MPSFGHLVRERRTQLGMTLTHLASRLGISRAYLSRIERDIEPPPSDAIIKRCIEILDLDHDETYAAAGRLPPDMRPVILDVIRRYRAFIESSERGVYTIS